MQPGDVIIDGGNEWYPNSIRWEDSLYLTWLLFCSLLIFFDIYRLVFYSPPLTNSHHFTSHHFSSLLITPLDLSSPHLFSLPIFSPLISNLITPLLLSHLPSLFLSSLHHSSLFSSLLLYSPILSLFSHLSTHLIITGGMPPCP